MRRHVSEVTPSGKQGASAWVVGAVATYVNLFINRRKGDRRLEIGPGMRRIDGFETISALYGRHIDYVRDVARPLPFKEGTFSLIYASHVLEHIAWYKTEQVLREWVRVLRPGGIMEIWVPNGLKICDAFVRAESEGKTPFDSDPWYRFNEEADPCKWAAGRIFTYGDGTGRRDDPNWHMAIFSPRYLRSVMEAAGLVSVTTLTSSDVRGHDHGWINLGMRGSKR